LNFSNQRMDGFDEAAELDRNARDFGTTAMDRDQFLPTGFETSQYQKDSCYKEIMHGDKAPAEGAWENSGLDVNLEQHYTAEVPVTYYTDAIGNADPHARSTVQVSCPTGSSTFGKNSFFSRPISEYVGGRHKCEEVEAMITESKLSNRHPKGTAMVPAAGEESNSLKTLKDLVIECLRRRWGLRGFALFREHVLALADSNQQLNLGDALKTVKEICPECDDRGLHLYLQNLCTMRKDSMQVNHLLKSLKPSTPNAVLHHIILAYQSGYRPTEVEAPAEPDAFVTFMTDLYVMQPSAIDILLP